MNDPCQYIVLHRSLQKYPGAACAQTAHAAAGALTSLPAPPDTSVVILIAETSGEIEAIAREAAIAGLHGVIVREPDEPYNGSACAFGLDIVERDSARNLFAKHKVFR